MYKVFKRVIDVFCALFGIILTSPLWLLAIVGILASDWGPVFYVSTRVGKGNRSFSMYKFRSMRVDRKANEASLRPDEERIFPFGGFIRRVKIDELPQLLNVLNGTMSVIGPRPVAQDQVELFRTGKWNEAAKCAAGLSGPAALYDFIYGDQITDPIEYMKKVFPTRRELEYIYVKNMSFGYDLKMVIYTVISILYALVDKECGWILSELCEDAKNSISQ